MSRGVSCRRLRSYEEEEGGGVGAPIDESTRGKMSTKSVCVLIHHWTGSCVSIIHHFSLVLSVRQVEDSDTRTGTSKGKKKKKLEVLERLTVSVTGPGVCPVMVTGRD